MKNILGIMQGRLLPPSEGRIQCFPRLDWAAEFMSASKAGLQSIEWIYDSFGEDANPLATAEGLGEIRSLSGKFGVMVRSVCADYFMEHPFVRVNLEEKKKSLSKLKWLLGQCSKINIGRMVIPFVDNSALHTSSELQEAKELLNDVVPYAQSLGVELHLETSLGPEEFSSFLSTLSNEWVKVNYDSGNSASLGFNVHDELDAYGHRIGSVHIKDRVRGGGTVPLGSGHVDFNSLFAGLGRLNYSGDFILQVARGTEGKEVPWAIQNRVFFEKYWSDVHNGSLIN